MEIFCLYWLQIFFYWAISSDVLNISSCFYYAVIFLSVSSIIRFRGAEMAAYGVLWMRICMFLSWREEEIEHLNSMCTHVPWLWLHRSLMRTSYAACLHSVHNLGCGRDNVVVEVCSVDQKDVGRHSVYLHVALTLLLRWLQICCLVWPFIPDNRPECRGNHFALNLISVLDILLREHFI